VTERPANRLLPSLAEQLAIKAGIELAGGEMLAKILTRNDDAGRHGVLIPSDAYDFFPPLEIPDPSANATSHFTSFDAIAGRSRLLAWKYYQRDPERRITRLSAVLDDRQIGRRLVVFLKARSTSRETVYVVAAFTESAGEDFARWLDALFGESIPADPGAFVRLPLDFRKFVLDAALRQLLARFDRISALEWVQSLRKGDTGLGYTFESLMEIEENNDRRADFMGIEIKCKLTRGSTGTQGKINLFQQAPGWHQRMPMKERLRLLGQRRADGTWACYSQVTTAPNNLALALAPVDASRRIDLLKEASTVGQWTFATLEKRLVEKHSRAVFVRADSRHGQGGVQYRYRELVYCERPSLARFIDLVRARDVVFEFAMREERGGAVRNHGYPWRLTSELLLDALFDVKFRLRG
jgi:hypothetical protein